MKGKKFKVLERGNFYFPYLYKGGKFIVEDTIDLEINGKNAELVDLAFKHKRNFYLGMLAEPIWNVLKKQVNKKQYKNCWFVPIAIMKFDKKYSVSVDILKKTK